MVESSLIRQKEEIAEMATRVTPCHLMLPVVTRQTTRFHSLSLVVPFVVTRCHSMYQLSVYF